MTKREKVLITVTALATGASVCMFAFVSLAHFLKSSPNVAPPIISKLYSNTVDQLATLEPIPLAADQTASSVINQQASTTIPAKASKMLDGTGHNSHYSTKNEAQVKQLIESNIEIKVDPRQLITPFSTESESTLRYSD